MVMEKIPKPIQIWLPFPLACLGEVLTMCVCGWVGVGMCTCEYRHPKLPEEHVDALELLQLQEDVRSPVGAGNSIPLQEQQTLIS